MFGYGRAVDVENILGCRSPSCIPVQAQAPSHVLGVLWDFLAMWRQQQQQHAMQMAIRQRALYYSVVVVRGIGWLAAITVVLVSGASHRSYRLKKDSICASFCPE